MDDVKSPEDNSIISVEKLPADQQITASCSFDQDLLKSVQIEKKVRRGRKFRHAGDKNSQINVNTDDNIVMQNKKHKKRFKKKLRGPLLRPVGSEVPQAPSNSTQFIMDNHENSSLFLDFNDGSEPKLKEADGSSPFQSADWFPYNVADFNYAYRSAKEDKLMNASRSDIKVAILKMQSKAAALTDHLSASPSRLLASLQSELLNLQEENSRLCVQSEKLKNEKCLCTSSSSGTSSSTSTSSSSDSSSDSNDSSGSSSSGSSDEDCSVQQLDKEDSENIQAFDETPPDSSLS